MENATEWKAQNWLAAGDLEYRLWGCIAATAMVLLMRRATAGSAKETATWT